METKELEGLSEQSRRAFEFVQKLYHEVSYMIREIEAALADEPEKFAICKPGGYGISTVASRRLEPVFVNQWLIRRFSVYFVPENRTQTIAGTSKTEFASDLKALCLRVVMDDKEIAPSVFFGVIYNITTTSPKLQKFEELISHIESQAQKVFANPERIEYEDGSAKFAGKLVFRTLKFPEMSNQNSLE
ncbi:MAG: hypothetical protein HPY71_14560 [Firmicutes bacterium]|nr:hypothetical protein [Bacillota bacterium]